MEQKGWRLGFWLLALLWLPAGVIAQGVVRFMPARSWPPDPDFWMTAVLTPSMAVLVPSGLPLALGCRRLSRSGYRRTAWIAGIGLGLVTVVASLVAGLLGPIAILLYALTLSLPVWIGSWWLSRRKRQ